MLMLLLMLGPINSHGRSKFSFSIMSMSKSTSGSPYFSLAPKTLLAWSAKEY
jgi:hypothetical protein